LFLTIFTASCGIIKDRSNEYVNAPKGKSLIIPPGLDASGIQPSHPIPKVANEASLPAKFHLPLPPDTASIPVADIYQVQGLGNQSWLLIQDPPGRIWPKLIRFLNDNGVQIKSQNAKSGVVITDSWNQSKNAEVFMAKTLKLPKGVTVDSATFTLSQGVKRRSSELVVSFVFSSALTDKQAMDVNKTILSSAADFFKQRKSDAGYSFLANDLGSSSKISIINNAKGDPILDVSLGFDRAWVAVQSALKESGVTIVDINRSTGEIYVNYHKNKNKGWFYWLFNSEKTKYDNYNAILVLSKKSNKEMQINVSKIVKPLTQSAKAEILTLLLKNMT
jgi:outer membrane protein assembly factor BamC